jgi:hypothetical protein
MKQSWSREALEEITSRAQSSEHSLSGIWHGLVSAFGSRFDDLTPDEKAILQQDVFSLAQDDGLDSVDAVKEFRRRIGGAKNLQSYVDTLVAAALRSVRGGHPGPGQNPPESRRMSLDVADPDSVPDVLRYASSTYQESASELASAWQDKRAGSVWSDLADILESAADRAERKLRQRGY